MPISHNESMYILLGAADSAPVAKSGLPALWEGATYGDSGFVNQRSIQLKNLGNFVRDLEASNSRSKIRWVWEDSRIIMPVLLQQGYSPSRCHDLRLAQRILKTAASRAQNKISYSPQLDLLTEKTPEQAKPPPTIPGQSSLFEQNSYAPDSQQLKIHSTGQLHQEFRAQLAALATAAYPQRFRLLLAAESSGGIIAAEMQHHGLPWNRQIHEKILEEALGPRPAQYQRPARLAELAGIIQKQLGSSRLNPDSPSELLKAMHRAGISVASTRQWELLAWAEENQQLQAERRALIEPILEYKKLARLYSANGWNWLDEWVDNNRFYPAYEVGGVVSGRWGAHGGGAMQIPKDLRQAITAEPGMLLTISDAQQLEPRILAAMSSDRKLALAGRGSDLYLGIAQLGQRTGSELSSRKQAKLAMLGAMYGATTGDSGRLLPHLRQLFPQALAFTEQASAIGQRGGQVTTYLGRTSPAPSAEWFKIQGQQGSATQERAAIRAARSFGRFTRNFVVQGTAAEWALCWMALIRHKLRTSGKNKGRLTSQLVYFLHDEIMIYGPQEEAELCASIIQASAQEAAHLIFGQTEVEFPVTTSMTTSYAKASSGLTSPEAF